MQGLEAHPLAVGIEAENPERRDDPRDAAEEQAGFPPALSALEVARAGDEVDPLDEAALLVDGEHEDFLAERDDVVGAAGPWQPHLRPAVLAADHARVEVPVPVDLGAADEAAVQEAALREQEGVRDARQHRRPVRGAHLVGRDREPSGRDPGADDAALDHQRQPRRVALLGEHRREEGYPDAREDGRVVAELARAHDGEQLGRRPARRPHRVSSLAYLAWRLRRSRPKRSR